MSTTEITPEDIEAAKHFNTDGPGPSEPGWIEKAAEHFAAHRLRSTAATRMTLQEVVRVTKSGMAELEETSRVYGAKIVAAHDAEMAAATARVGQQWREALEWALGLEPDPENHTPDWAREVVREIREIGNRR